MIIILILLIVLFWGGGAYMGPGIGHYGRRGSRADLAGRPSPFAA